MQQSQSKSASPATGPWAVVRESLILLTAVGGCVATRMISPAASADHPESAVRHARADLRAISRALDVYALQEFEYPTSLEQLAKHSGRTGVAVPLRDPWGNPYQFISAGQSESPTVFTFGSDGKPGGTSDAADLNTNDAVESYSILRE
jgi:general secretion pathway protein G